MPMLLVTLWLTGVVVSATPPYKMLTGYPMCLDEEYTPNDLLTSRGYVVEEKNSDRKNTTTNVLWEGNAVIDSWPFNVTICSKKLLDMTKLSLNLDHFLITPCYNETTDISIIGMPGPPCCNLVFCNGTKLGTLTVKVSCDPSVCPENNFGISMEVIFPTSQVTLCNLKLDIIGQPVTIIKQFVKVITP